MLPVIDNTLCNQVSRLLAINMPRVVPDQRDKFENDELFRKLSRDSEVSVDYTVIRVQELYLSRKFCKNRSITIHCNCYE